MFNSTILKENKIIHLIASVLFLTFLACTFVLDGSKYKTIFYITLPIPSLLLLREVIEYRKEELKILLFLTITLLYFSLSTLWSHEPDLIDNLKNSLLIFLLLVLSIEYCKTISYEKTVDILFYFTSLSTAVFLITLFYKNNFNLPINTRLNLSSIFDLSENNPISSGVILGVTILLSIEALKNSSKIKTLLALITIISALTLLILTKSRGPLISLAITSTLLLLVQRNTRTTVLILSAYTATLILIVSTSLYEIMIQRLNQPNYRLDIWQETLSMMKESWLFGLGLGGKAGISIGSGSLSGFTHSHSFMLESFRTGGIVGFLIFSSFIITISYQSIKNNENRLFFTWLIFGMLCLLTNGRFPLMRPSIEWFCFWIPLFLWYGYSLKCTIRQN